jgi:hypothetical protein
MGAKLHLADLAATTANPACVPSRFCAAGVRVFFVLPAASTNKKVLRGESQMKSHYLGSAMLGFAMLATIIAPAAQATEWDRKTIVSFDAPVRIQNTVLDAGQHVFKLLDTAAPRDVVLVFNGDESKLEAIVIANHVSRLEPTSDAQFTFHRSVPGSRPALGTWFYPGQLDGLEFSLPKQRADSAAKVARAAPAGQQNHSQGE